MNHRLRIFTGVAALVLGLLAPFFLSTFSMSIATTALIFAIFAVGLNLVLGYAGLPSLGHAAFFGAGAYAVALLVPGGAHGFGFAVAAAVGSSALLGVILGPVLLRTRGTYFLMASLAVGEIMRNLAISWRSLTSGDDGIYGIGTPTVAGVDLSDSRAFYYFLLAALLITLGVTAVLMRAPFGHALRAVRDNGSRIATLGVRPLAVELTAFVFSAAIAGFAGAMFAYSKGGVSPEVLSVETSSRVLLMVVLGGASTLSGPVLGALVIEAIRGIGSTWTDRWLTVLGLVSVLVAVEPQRLLRARLARLAARRHPAAPSSETPAAHHRHPGLGGTDTAAAMEDLALRGPAGAAGAAVLSVRGLSKRFGGLQVLNGISFEVTAGERRGLIGPNGAGKTTLLNMLSGIERPTAGQVAYRGADVTGLAPFQRARLGIGRTFQTCSLFDDCSVRENILLALLAHHRRSLRFVQPLSAYQGMQEEADHLLEQWKLADHRNTAVKRLSYGERRLVEIVLALAIRPQLLLLDEPAAGLSGAETGRIIQTLSALDRNLSILIVEHDMDLVFSVCDRVTVIAAGRVLAEGSGDEVRGNEEVVEAYLGMPL